MLNSSLTTPPFSWDNISPEKQRLLEEHLRLILQTNSHINLTRISSFEEGRLLHIEDSLAGLSEVLSAPSGLYADLGSGAGYPGIPLAVAAERKVVLVDSVSKKMKALDSIIMELGISSQVTTYAGRIEELSLEKREKFAVLTARALTSLPSLLELAAPLLRLSGRLICYKAQPSEEELCAAISLQEKLGMILISDRKLLLSDGITARRILVFEKQFQATLVLPRRVGMAQKRPLA